MCGYREGAGPLRRGSEPFRHPGAGLPDDQAKPDTGGSHQNGEGPQGRHPQPGVPPPAQRPGRHPEGKPQDVPTELKAPSAPASHRRAEVAASLVTLRGEETAPHSTTRGSSPTGVAGFDFNQPVRLVLCCFSSY